MFAYFILVARRKSHKDEGKYIVHADWTPFYFVLQGPTRPLFVWPLGEMAVFMASPSL